MTKDIILNNHKPARIKTSFGDKMISVITYLVYALLAFACVYPFYYLIINSISDNKLSEASKIIFLPHGIHFDNYVQVMLLPDLLPAAKISVLRTVIGASLTVISSAFLGFMFTRETMWHRKLWYRLVTVTMYINAGIIPWYLTMKLLGLTDNFWGYIFPLIIQPYYIVLCKTYCESVPHELQDAGEIDGAGTLRVFFSIILPVIKPILATIAVFAAVNQWNAFQDTVLLMTKGTDNYTLQFILWRYINSASALKAVVSNAAASSSMVAALAAKAATETSVRMTVTVIVVIPIMCVYPFFQRFFTKGIMIGAVKG